MVNGGEFVTKREFVKDASTGEVLERTVLVDVQTGQELRRTEFFQPSELTEQQAIQRETRRFETELRRREQERVEREAVIAAGGRGITEEGIIAARVVLPPSVQRGFVEQRFELPTIQREDVERQRLLFRAREPVGREEAIRRARIAAVLGKEAFERRVAAGEIPVLEEPERLEEVAESATISGLGGFLITRGAQILGGAAPAVVSTIGGAIAAPIAFGLLATEIARFQVQQANGARIRGSQIFGAVGAQLQSISQSSLMVGRGVFQKAGELSTERAKQIFGTVPLRPETPEFLRGIETGVQPITRFFVDLDTEIRRKPITTFATVAAGIAGSVAASRNLDIALAEAGIRATRNVKTFAINTVTRIQTKIQDARLARIGLKIEGAPRGAEGLTFAERARVGIKGVSGFSPQEARELGIPLRVGKFGGGLSESDIKVLGIRPREEFIGRIRVGIERGLSLTERASLGIKEAFGPQLGLTRGEESLLGVSPLERLRTPFVREPFKLSSALSLREKNILNILQTGGRAIQFRLEQVEPITRLPFRRLRARFDLPLVEEVRRQTFAVSPGVPLLLGLSGAAREIDRAISERVRRISAPIIEEIPVIEAGRRRRPRLPEVVEIPEIAQITPPEVGQFQAPELDIITVVDLDLPDPTIPDEPPVPRRIPRPPSERPGPTFGFPSPLLVPGRPRRARPVFRRPRRVPRVRFPSLVGIRTGLTQDEVIRSVDIRFPTKRFVQSLTPAERRLFGLPLVKKKKKKVKKKPKVKRRRKRKKKRR
jgi:hypothetical protein